MRGAQACHELVEPGVGRLVQPLALAVAQAHRHLHVHHDDGAPEQVVEDHHAVRDHHHGVGETERVGGAPRQTLDRPDEVVTEIADRPAGEPRQARHRDRRQPAQPFGEVADRILRLARRRPPVAPRPALDAALAVPPHLPRLGPEESVARPALASHQRLEQERERRPRDFGERRDRGVGVEHHLAHDRHQAALPGAAQELRTRVGH